MLNEGMVTSDSKVLVKSAMLRELAKLGATTPRIWERAVFKALTGHDHDEVDWELADNQAGYYTWVKSFDQLIDELIDDGYVKEQQLDAMGRKRLVLTEGDGNTECAQLHCSANP